MSGRETSIYYARLAEQGERYQDMIKYMKAVARVSKFFNKQASTCNCLCVCVGGLFIEWRAQFALSGLQEFCGHTQSRLAHNQCHLRQRRVQGLQAPGPHQGVPTQDRDRTQWVVCWCDSADHEDAHPQQLPKPRGQSLLYENARWLLQVHVRIQLRWHVSVYS